jgi:anti-anti-sigma regulatory factor
MLDLAPARELTVERGPDWLFVKIGSGDADRLETPPLAERLWSLLQEHLVYRLVLELDLIDVLESHLIGQLVVLHNWISERGGVLRLCGLSKRNHRVLKRCHLDGHFPAYGNRMDAVMCREAVPAPRRPR